MTPIAARVFVTLVCVVSLSSFAAAQIRPAKVTWRRTVSTGLRADPCHNPSGVASQTTWLGSEGSAVQEQRVTFCTREEAERELERRLDRPNVELTSGAGTPLVANRPELSDAPEPDGGVWALIPDHDSETIDPKVTRFLHYYLIVGTQILDLTGSDERHIKLVLAEMRSLTSAYD